MSDDLLRGVRWGAVAVWVIGSALSFHVEGVPFDRTGLLLWIALGLIAWSIGKRALWTVVVDFLPLAAVLFGYDYLRGVSETLGMPTWWHPQADVDRFLFFGHIPTVWLQERLKHADVRWYDVLVCLCYLSFFFLPYVTAGVLWLRSRADFYRWSLRFVTLSFLGFVLFALMPAAPPWAAARCTAADVADHPNNPPCLDAPADARPLGGLLGQLHHTRPGANPWLERIPLRGFSELHLSAARSLLEEGQQVVDQVAAVPSLHAGGTMLFVIFLWPRVRTWWKPVLVAYPVLMAFSLAYSGEHYISDQLAGWLCAALVALAANRVEGRWKTRRRALRDRAPDTLGPQPEQAPSGRRSDPVVENPCPPTQPLSETTPSST
jgi:membrane-associated phospholipid phosphatase